MLMNYYEFSHNVLNMCFYTGPALVLAVIMIIMGLVHGRNQKKREKDFEKELEEKLKGSSPAAPEEAVQG